MDVYPTDCETCAYSNDTDAEYCLACGEVVNLDVCQLALECVRPGLFIQIYHNFLNEAEVSKLIPILDKNVKWSRPTFPEHKRSNGFYGDERVVGAFDRHAIPWSEGPPELLTLKERIEKIIPDKFNICVVQRYPSGKVGISLHRDREVPSGTAIVGISLGTRRNLIMKRYGERISLSLPSGSLYVLHAPTNDTWMHAIEKDATETPRYSLTYRINTIKNEPVHSALRAAI